MSLYSTVNKILSIARRQPDVFDAGEGDIYEALNGRMDVAYPIVWLTQQQHPQDIAVDGDFNTFTFTMFYVDRLTSDKSNRLQVQSHAIEVLQNIARELELETDLPTKNYVTFTERFESLCAGAYLEFSMYDLIDDGCVETFAPPALYHMYYHTTDGKTINTNSATEFGAGLLVFNRAMEETAYSYIDGETYSVNGELIFYGAPTEVPENSLFRNDNLDAIYLLPTIGAIGNNAFSECLNLRTIGGSAATENIVSYGFTVFSDTKIGETFSLGSKTIYVSDWLLRGVNNFPDGVIGINMPLAKWRTDVSKSAVWSDYTNIQCYRFTDVTVCGRVFFDAHEDIGSDVTTTQVTFETSLDGFKWNAWWNGDYIFCSGQWNGGEKSITVSGIPTVTYGSVYGAITVEAVSEDGFSYGQVTFAKAEPEPPVEYTFTFNNSEGEVFGSGTTANTISWTTDYPGVVTWDFSEGTSGMTSSDRVTVTFAENTGETMNIYYFTAYDDSGETLGEISFYVLGEHEDSGSTSGDTEYYPDARSGYSNEYLTLEIISGGTLEFNSPNRFAVWLTATKEYSRDNGQTWTAVNSGSTINVNSGERINLRGVGTGEEFKWDLNIGGTAIFNAEGNIRSYARYAYYMFGRSNIVSAKNLIIEQGDWCDIMFSNCEKLVEAPALPAKKVSNNAYYGMFLSCTSLETAPALPATVLGKECYRSMFAYCTSLTAAPELPAATLVDGCYRSMFDGCSKLAYIKCLATDISASDCLRRWVGGVSSTGTFVKAAGTVWPEGIAGIPKNWTVEEAS